MTTASISTPAVKSSCPRPSNASVDRAANTATTPTRDAGHHTERDGPAAARHAARRRQHDADDQAGFQHLAENDDECSQHGATPTISTPCAVFS